MYFFLFFFLLQIEKKPSRRSPTKKKTPDSDVNRGGKSESGVFFLSETSLMAFFQFATQNKNKKIKKVQVESRMRNATGT